MVNPLGPRIAKYAAAKANHDVVLTMKQGLKLAVRFVQGSGRGMKAIYDSAQAKKDAREAVISARQNLDGEGIYHSANLNYLGSILSKVVQLTPEGEKKKLEKLEYRVALFDEAWKASIGKKKGILLLRTEKRITGDGTKKLRSGMRRAIGRDGLEEFRTAKSLVRLLHEVKKCSNQEGCSARVPATGALMDVFIGRARSLSSSSELLSKFPHIGLPLGLALLRGIDPANKKYLEALDPFTGGRASDIDPELSKMQALTELSKALADQYLGKLSLSDEQKKDFGRAVKSAETFEEVVGNLQNAYQASLIEYDRSNGSVARDVGEALYKLLHPTRDRRDALQRARDIARPVVEEVAAALPARLKKMDIELESSEGHTALLAAARKQIAMVQPSSISDETMDRALQEECWDAIFNTQDKVPEQPKSERAQDQFGNASPRQIQSALTAAKVLPVVISGPELLKLVGTHFEVFSGPVWRHHEARVSLLEYLGLALAINVLKTLKDKDEYTAEDTKLFRSTLKKQANAPDVGMLEFSFSGGPDSAAPNQKVATSDLQEMIEEVHDRYFSGDTNLYGQQRAEYDTKYAAARSATEKIEALTLGMTLLIQQVKLERSRLVEMLDVLSLLHPVYKRESLVTDD
jgi:hypothetical protein